jgi:hypothetical protein
MAGFAPSLTPAKSEIEAGESITIAVDAKHPPNGLLYKWSATVGQCNPQESDKPQTTYKAPPRLTDDKDLTVTVTVRFVLDGRPRDERTVNITVKQTKTLAAQSPSPPPIPPTDTKPTIQITQVPPHSLGGPEGLYEIVGKVSGASASQYRVVLYAQTDYWYIQPFNVGELRFTEIEGDGSFSNKTHGGTRYAALLVRNSFTAPPIKTDELPAGKDVVASDVVKGVKKM